MLINNINTEMAIALITIIITAFIITIGIVITKSKKINRGMKGTNALIAIEKQQNIKETK